MKNPYPDYFSLSNPDCIMNTEHRSKNIFTEHTFFLFFQQNFLSLSHTIFLSYERERVKQCQSFVLIRNQLTNSLKMILSKETNQQNHSVRITLMSKTNAEP